MSVTAAQGFVAGGVHAGIRHSKLDLAIVRSTVPAVGAAMLSRNRVQAACLLVNREHLALTEPQAVVINSGVANAATGERGSSTRSRPPPRPRACSTSTRKRCSCSRPA